MVSAKVFKAYMMPKAKSQKLRSPKFLVTNKLLNPCSTKALSAIS